MDIENWDGEIEDDPNANEELEESFFTGTLMGQYAATYLSKEPCRTSAQTGHAWVQEILQGHPTRCYQMFRMEVEIFHEFCRELVECGLTQTRRMGVEEMVAMFLNMVGHGVGNRMSQERFQHSGETVSRHFHRVLAACLQLSFKYIKPQDPTFRRISPKIRKDRRYWPFFKDAIGAIDGTHVHCVVSLSEQPKYIGRKSFPSQNVMAVCDWDMCFTFVLAGWEGTAHDARVFCNALTTPGMNFPRPPPGKYYLVDAGYPTPLGYIGPYKCERYHLPEFRRSSTLRNENEAFNYSHSSLRCTIERTFGVWKNRFAILQNMPKYKFETQVQIVAATMAIHNFIRRNSTTDYDFIHYENENVVEEVYDEQESDPIPSLDITSSVEMNIRRDCIRDEIVAHMQNN